MKANNVVKKHVVLVRHRSIVPLLLRASQLSRSFLLLGQHRQAQTTFTDFDNTRRKPDSAQTAYSHIQRIQPLAVASTRHYAKLIRSTLHTQSSTTTNQILHTHQVPMPALFARHTNTPTMSGANPFHSANNAVAAGQENQTTEAQQHKQVLEKRAAEDKKYVQEDCRRKPNTKECPERLRWTV